MNRGKRIIYESDSENRTASGNAVLDIAKYNDNVFGIVPDLTGSVKFAGFRDYVGEYDPSTGEGDFSQAGIAEQNAASVAAALSLEGVVVFYSTFGVFASVEVFSQLRIADQNKTNLNIIGTHCGLNVGEDGETHQCLEDIGIIRNLHGYNVFAPADANQTDEIIRYMAETSGNKYVRMGRGKTPIIRKPNGAPYFGSDYRFALGKSDLIKDGSDATIITYGEITNSVLKASELLKGNLSVRVINMASIIPFDEGAVLKAAEETKKLLVVEEHNKNTGLGSMIGLYLAKHPIKYENFDHIGLSDYGKSGNPEELLFARGLSPKHIAEKIYSMKE